MKNKQELQNQIEDMKQKLAEMEALLNEPEASAYYWQPKEDDKIYYMNYLGEVRFNSYTTNYQEDKARYRVFKTKKEAEKYAEYVKAEETLKRVIAEANVGYDYSWSGFCNYKYYVSLIIEGKILEVHCTSKTKTYPSFMYIADEKVAEKLMKEYEAEFKTYLSY